MKLELLKKLTRLANNNPNDNEANLAARKVCKMLEEGKFQLPTETVKTAANKVRTWADVTRSTEPMWSSKTYDSGPEPMPPEFWELLQKLRQEREQRYKEQTRGHSKNEKEIRICIQCNEKVEVSCNEPPNYICGKCKWEKWEKSRT
jgi:hypothetical protein